MWSSVVLFVLTFAVLGLLLGFAAVYNANRHDRAQGTVVQENLTANMTGANHPPAGFSGK
jgi:hypothetical protein